MDPQKFNLQLMKSETVDQEEPFNNDEGLITEEQQLSIGDDIPEKEDGET